MKKRLTDREMLGEYLSCAGKTVIDVGCGNGDTVRWLAAQGARVIGLDNRAMLVKARANIPVGPEEYCEGGAQSLPFGDESADIILYSASFHHVPVESMTAAACECLRVLKKGGEAVFVEPVYHPGAYSEITGLVENESELIRRAYEAIVSLAGLGLKMAREEFFYFERSFADYIRLLNFFVEDAGRREAILVQARKLTERFSAAAGRSFADFRYRSICRLNILIKEVGVRSRY